MSLIFYKYIFYEFPKNTFFLKHQQQYMSVQNTAGKKISVKALKLKILVPQQKIKIESNFVFVHFVHKGSCINQFRIRIQVRLKANTVFRANTEKVNRLNSLIRQGKIKILQSFFYLKNLFNIANLG